MQTESALDWMHLPAQAEHKTDRLRQKSKTLLMGGSNEKTTSAAVAAAARGLRLPQHVLPHASQGHPPLELLYDCVLLVVLLLNHLRPSPPQACQEPAQAHER